MKSESWLSIINLTYTHIKSLKQLYSGEGLRYLLTPSLYFFPRKRNVWLVKKHLEKSIVAKFSLSREWVDSYWALKSMKNSLIKNIGLKI